MRLANKIAIVTGGAQGMGASEARLFASEGASVVICDILDERGRRVAGEINETGATALYLHLDVTNEDQWRSAVATTLQRFGRLDILVNNAGVSGSTGLSLEETTVDGWDATMDVNARGVFLGIRAAIPAMRDSGGGSIVNISSQLGLVASERVSAEYHASKGAVRVLTKYTAIQHAGQGIRCNSVHPGPITTPMSEASQREPGRRAETLARVPLGRYGEPDEVAYGVLYLASDESSFVTGSELVIDGGWTAT